VIRQNQVERLVGYNVAPIMDPDQTDRDRGASTVPPLLPSPKRTSDLRALAQQIFLVLRKWKPEPIGSVFTKTYRERSWGGEQSRSGKGSDTEYTSSIRGYLPALLRELDVRIFLDAPCGDFNWMKQVDLGRTKYSGIDIVLEMIAEDIRRYRDESREFRILDFTKGPVPRADLILCRDCLVHLSFRDSFAAIRNFKSSGSEYLLITTFPGVRRNEDVPTGGWRPMNLEVAPFLFPEPIRAIREDDTEQRFVGLRRSLGLWRLQDVPLPMT